MTRCSASSGPAWMARESCGRTCGKSTTASILRLRLHLFALAYNLGGLLRRRALPRRRSTGAAARRQHWYLTVG